MKNKFLIYLCGGMTGLSYEDQNNWRSYLKAALEEIQPSVYCYNPVDYFTVEEVNEGGADVQRRAMNLDLYKLRSSSLVICNFNNPNSLGTMAELAIAHDRGIPIVGLNINHKELHPWCELMCETILDSIEDLILYISKMYLK